MTANTRNYHGPGLLAQEVGLQRWQVDCAARTGMLPRPRHPRGWLPEQVAEVREHAGAVVERFGGASPEGAARCAVRLGARLGRDDVVADDVEALAASGALVPAGSRGGRPLFARPRSTRSIPRGSPGSPSRRHHRTRAPGWGVGGSSSPCSPSAVSEVDGSAGTAPLPSTRSPPTPRCARGWPPNGWSPPTRRPRCSVWRAGMSTSAPRRAGSVACGTTKSSWAAPGRSTSRCTARRTSRRCPNVPGSTGRRCGPRRRGSAHRCSTSSAAARPPVHG